MRQVSDDQRYLNFTAETSLKVVEEYRSKYERISELLDANEVILWLVHEDLEGLSTSRQGREAKYTTENLFRALLVHQIEGTSLRETVNPISSATSRLAASSTVSLPSSFPPIPFHFPCPKPRFLSARSTCGPVFPSRSRKHNVAFLVIAPSTTSAPVHGSPT